jgi:curved DNA-binding protein CbpA
MSLGLTKSTSRVELKTKYKALAKANHPDCGGDEAKFKEINEAYTECNRLLDERDFDEKYGAREEQAAQSNQRRRRATRYDDDDGYNDEGYRNGHAGSQVRTEEERRDRLCMLFETATDPNEIDELLTHCLQSGVFDKVDLGEPLLRALGRYHLGMHLGIDHVQRCFKAINEWEDWHHKRAPQCYYHPVLVIYSDPSQNVENPMTDISGGVTAILEEIEAKGYLPDDWSVSLANRVFRTSPIAW